MLRFLLSRQIGKMEAAFGYDATYMRDLLAVSPWILIRFLLAASLGHGRRAPREALAAASLVGTLAEDCGPCTQISVDLALAGGVSPACLAAILAGDALAMGEAACLSWRFAKASLKRDMEACQPLRDEIVARWGRGGLLDVALALTTARMYPTLKYALGHGAACSRVTVGGQGAVVAPMSVLAA